MYSLCVATTDDRETPIADDWPNLTWDRLVDVLRAEVSPEAGALFAEPIADPARGVTHWHVLSPNEPKPLHALAPQEREALLARFEKIAADIRAYAERLAAAGGETNLRLAHALHTAVVTSDQNAQLWSLGGAPVLTGWGRRRIATTAAAPAILTRDAEQAGASGGPSERSFIPGLARIPSPSGLARRLQAPDWSSWRTDWRDSAWLLWLPFWLLIGAILYHLLPACGMDLPLLRGLSRCDGAARVDDLDGRNEALRRAVFEEQKRLAALCAETRPRAQTDNVAPPNVEKTKARLEDNQLKAGRLDITLAWDGREDLDLHVRCGEGHLFFKQRNACGGVLDHDANVREPVLDRPVEHATWESDPPPGLYKVSVAMASRNGNPERPVPFTLLMRSGGKEQVYRGVMNGLEETPVTTFERH
ncbi:hypothetical protein [Methylocystis bryophila]|uniref:DUF2135 domain-containing protein n=1 Tax=Methylocystis bryophila TaxID=655015 RepID=A0A1W6MU51_9HYPH|nr:hypothetical protein [Methylocystis bryophila]ARN81128.1 hypothetical protein B1812_08590 [Methylocystis bryophila]BDV37056.1 hypothetical protein DSM21852_03090 [Methylocystis bryophila]